MFKNIYNIFFFFFLKRLMIKSSRLEKDQKTEDIIIKDVKNLFRLNKEINDATSKEKINRSILKEENKAIKDKVIRDVRNLSEHEEEN